MKKSIPDRISIVAVVVGLLVVCLAVARLSRCPEQNAHWSTHRIEVSGGRSCSATAIGPHALLTATHCESAFADIKIDGSPAHVDRIIYDTSDHSIYLLSGIIFYHIASIAPTKLGQGDAVYIYGNPEGVATHFDYLRRGYVVAIENNRKQGSVAVMDLNGFFGDSGAAVFNACGEIETAMNTLFVDGTEDSLAVIKVTKALDLSFRPSDYALARAYGR